MPTDTVGSQPVQTVDPPAPHVTPWAHVAGVSVALTAFLALLLAAFAWPASQTGLHDASLAVAGPPQAVEQVRRALAQQQPGVFDVSAARDAARAQALVRDRDVDAALILGRDGPSVVVATQGGPALAQALTQVGDALAGQHGVPVTDVAPAAPDDPRGAALSSGALPLVLVGAAGGAVLALRVRGPARAVAGALLFALLAGPTAVAVLHGWLGALTGGWLVESAVVSLGLAAIALAVIGVEAVAGHVGLVLAELTVVAVGNPLSAASSAPGMLPDGWRQLGQALPPGALVSAVRSVSGLDGAGAVAPVAGLVSWLLAGLLLAAVGARLSPAGRSVEVTARTYDRPSTSPSSAR